VHLGLNVTSVESLICLFLWVELPIFLEKIKILKVRS